MKLVILALFIGYTAPFLHNRVDASVANPAVTDETIAQFEDWFSRKGIQVEYDATSFDEIYKWLTDEQKNLTLIIQSSSQDEAIKWQKKKKAFYDELITSFENPQNLQNEKTKQELFYRAKSIIYMMFAKEALDAQEKRRESIERFNPKVIIRTVRAFLERKSLLHVAIPTDTKRPLTAIQKNKESRLIMPQEEDLPKNMSSDMVSHFDISENHPLFFPIKHYDLSRYQWPEFEERLEKETTLLLKKSFPVFETSMFRLKEAGRLLFFHSIKNSQTSAKVDSEDVFGHTWKLKWSDEVHSEVMANRFYYNLGATYVDQVYVPKAGREGMILILSKKPSLSTELSEHSTKNCPIFDKESFVDCFKKSRFRFDTRPYIDEEGIISEENIHTFVSSLPLTIQSSVKKEQLLGRHYLTFKEVSMEFKPKDKLVTAGGPYSFTRFGAEHDRGVRGLLLFNSWINGGDVKESNNKGYLISPKLLPDFRQKALASSGQKYGQVFVAAQHDMGKSLAGIFESANPNQLDEKNFIFKKNGQVGFDFLLLDTPRAWHRTTYADLLWMARRMVPMTKSIFQQIVAETQWPDFQQQAMVYKLQKRRNRIAEIFGLEHLLPSQEKTITAPNLTLSLKTPLERGQQAIRYGLQPEQLESIYQQYHGEKMKEDAILRNGQLAPCQNSPIIRALHLHKHPIGLDRRRTRYGFINALRPDQKPCGGIRKTEIMK